MARVGDVTRIWEINIHWPMYSQCSVWDGKGVEIWECIISPNLTHVLQIPYIGDIWLAGETQALAVTQIVIHQNQITLETLVLLLLAKSFVFRATLKLDLIICSWAICSRSVSYGIGAITLTATECGNPRHRDRKKSHLYPLSLSLSSSSFSTPSSHQTYEG
ncbi:hypothetical protein DFJ43DRAFT_1159960 [Lentinula guzmanii]|uniref:Uncharacterized protein n=1 Tax=Lentinula guzmanii TaxID=2804957 RepID=A0AA38J4H6_9AGAR|nr:hypothetical protein DFJ43DRAFT_1159960 [Lentinula guzmanii]